MKTTVELADDLLARARSLAQSRGWTVRLVLEESLRSYLDKAFSEDSPSFRLRHTVVKGTGLQKPGMTFEEMAEMANAPSRE